MATAIMENVGCTVEPVRKAESSGAFSLTPSTGRA